MGHNVRHMLRERVGDEADEPQETLGQMVRQWRFWAEVAVVLCGVTVVLWLAIVR